MHLRQFSLVTVLLYYTAFSFNLNRFLQYSSKINSKSVLSMSELVQSSKIKPVVAVDIDEVLAFFIPALANFHNFNYGTSLTSENFVSYQFHEVWGGSKEECSSKVELFFESTHFETIEPIPGAFEALKKLQADFDLQIVTARQHKQEQLTREWVGKYFPDIFTAFHFGNHYATSGRSRSKPEMCAEIGALLLIDDNFIYATQCAKVGIPVILFGDYAWNRHGEVGSATDHGTSGDPTPAASSSGSGDLIQRVSSWDDVIDVVHRLSSKVIPTERDAVATTGDALEPDVSLKVPSQA